MPEPERVPAFAPDGTPITVPKADVRPVIEGGGRVMSPGEEKAEREKIRLKEAANKPVTPTSLAEGWLAGQHAAFKGVGEAFGVPVDTGVAALFGKEGTDYIKRLDEEHPYITGVEHVTGQVRGALGAAELTGGGGGSSLLGRSLYGGAENVVQATTHDVNEDALGRAETNGDKLLANIPKHFAVGFGLTAVLGGTSDALSRAAVEEAPALGRASDRLIGHEVGETGAAAERAGARIREAGGVPANRRGLLDTLEQEQAAARKTEKAGYEAKVDELRGAQQTEAAGLAARQEAQRKALAVEGPRAVRAAEERVAGQGLAAKVEEAARPIRIVEDQYAATRQALASEREQAAALASQIERERTDNAKQLADLLSGQRKAGNAPADAIPEHFDTMLSEVQAAIKRGRAEKKSWEALHPEIERQFPELTPQDVGSAMHAVDTGRFAAWKADMAEQLAPKPSLTEAYEKLKLLTEGDAPLPTAAEGAQKHIERLKSMADDLERAHSEALSHLKKIDSAASKVEAQYQKDLTAAGKIADQQVAGFQKAGAKEASAAEREASQVTKSVERNFAKERGALGKEHAAAEKAIPKPTGKTEVDPWIKAAREKGEAGFPIERGAAIGAGMSLLHGHPLGAATAMLGSFAAGRVRAEGNFIAARALRGLSDRLANVDEQIRRGVASLFGRSGTRIVALGTNGGRQETPPKAPQFEDVSRRVLEASANPSIVTEHVRQALGPDAAHAPQTFASTLAAAQRMQQVLEAKLPRQMVDAKSLTPQLDEPGISDTEKDEFMRTVAVLNDPIRELFAETRDGTITPEQIEAVQFVYGPGLYSQIQSEVRIQVSQLRKPLDYEREIAIGTLLGGETSEVLDRDFQSSLRAAFQDKTAQGAPQVKSKGSDKLSSNTMSTSQKIEQGER